MTTPASSDVLLHTKSQRYGEINEMLDINEVRVAIDDQITWALG